MGFCVPACKLPSVSPTPDIIKDEDVGFLVNSTEGLCRIC
jgi:hypothetical protein